MGRLLSINMPEMILVGNKSFHVLHRDNHDHHHHNQHHHHHHHHHHYYEGCAWDDPGGKQERHLARETGRHWQGLPGDLIMRMMIILITMMIAMMTMVIVLLVIMLMMMIIIVLTTLMMLKLKNVWQKKKDVRWSFLWLWGWFCRWLLWDDYDHQEWKQQEAKDAGYSNYFEITTRESLDQVFNFYLLPGVESTLCWWRFFLSFFISSWFIVFSLSLFFVHVRMVFTDDLGKPS